MHSKTLKRKAAEALDLSNFIAKWTDPYPVPHFTLFRPNKFPRSDRTIGHWELPNAPPSTPESLTYPWKTEPKPPPPQEDDTFQLSTTERAWLRKTPSLEAKMCRNHKLRDDFAKVGPLLKAALTEMASRALKKLEENEKWHKEGENQLGHYRIVQALEKKANTGIRSMNALSRFKRNESGKRLVYDRAVIEGEYKKTFEEVREKALGQIRAQMILAGYDLDEDENVRALVPEVAGKSGGRDLQGK